METIYNILREMRDRNEVRKVRLRQYGGVHCNCSIMPDDLPKVYADRIEKAAKWRDQYIEKLTNENASLRAELNKDDCLKLDNDVDPLRAENERLKKCVSGECDRISVDAELCSDCPFAEIDSVRTENERLKAALQPVLDIVMDSATSDLSMELAIKEAKRIYKESMK